MTKRKAVSIALVFFIVFSIFFSFFFSHKYIRNIGEDGFTHEELIALRSRNKDEEGITIDYALNFLTPKSIIEYAKYVGIEIPECDKLKQYRRSFKEKYPSCISSELDLKAKTALVREQLYSPIYSVPVVDKYDDKVAETISRCVNGYLVRIKKSDFQDKGSLEKYLLDLEKINECQSLQEKEKLLQEFNFQRFTNQSHFSLFNGMRCKNCPRPNQCKSCMLNFKKTYDSFNISNSLKFNIYEGVAITCAKQGQLMIFEDPKNSDKMFAIFITDSYLDDKVFVSIKKKVRSEFYTHLCKIFDESIVRKIHSRTILNPPNLFMMIFAILIFM